MESAAWACCVSVPCVKPSRRKGVQLFYGLHPQPPGEMMYLMLTSHSWKRSGTSAVFHD